MIGTVVTVIVIVRGKQQYSNSIISEFLSAVRHGNPFKLSVNYCRTNTRKNFLANVL